jgi:hypothetical protein
LRERAYEVRTKDGTLQRALYTEQSAGGAATRWMALRMGSGLQGILIQSTAPIWWLVA